MRRLSAAASLYCDRLRLVSPTYIHDTALQVPSVVCEAQHGTSDSIILDENTTKIVTRDHHMPISLWNYWALSLSVRVHGCVVGTVAAAFDTGSAQRNDVGEWSPTNKIGPWNDSVTYLTRVMKT
jgi:hypothetical protein